jgi:hypothetical protein
MFNSSVLVATSFFLVLVSIAAGEEDGSGGGGASWLSAVEDGNGKPPVFPNACVKMALYNNTMCNGHAQRVLLFPTWAKPQDSPCCTYDLCFGWVTCLVVTDSSICSFAL